MYAILLQEFEKYKQMLKWLKVQKTWHMAAIFIRSSFSLLKSGPAPDSIVQIRRRSCFGDDETPPCPSLSVQNGKKYCGACGCPRLPMARLDTEKEISKLHYPYLECPLERAGFSNEKIS